MRRTVGLCVATLAFAVAAMAQVPLGPAPLPSPDGNASALGANGDGNASRASQGLGAQRGQIDSGGSVALRAQQIEAILERRPEVTIELKSLLAEAMQQQGIQIQADGVTDEMLYREVSSSRDFRAQVTAFLRARGYVSDDTLRGEAPGIEDGTDVDVLSVQDAVPGRPENGKSERRSPMGTGASIGDGDGWTPEVPIPDSTARRTAPEKPSDESLNNSTDLPRVLRRPAPYNLQSMRDLYTQIPDQTAPLKRFGSEVFLNRDGRAMTRGGTGRDTPLDVPVGPDYVVGPGDTLTINQWGGVTQTITRVVDRDGRLLLPEGGSIDVAGMALGRVQSMIESLLKRQYRDAQVAVTVSQLRSVRVYVVGDVQRPGGYDISSLATPLSALYAAGGPTAAGSLRMLRHYRGEKLIEEIDLYDFLLHGQRKENLRFESGDTLLVPPAGPQVAIFGAVKRPSIYELKEAESTLATVEQDAGGFTVAAALGRITIERIDAHQQRETVTLELGKGDNAPTVSDAIAAFKVRDGDRIRVAPILPYSERAIYVEGHVSRPGRMPYRDGMRLGDVLRSYRDMLPEPADHGEIVRLVPPDLHAETVGFDVPEVLIGNANPALQPFDTIRIAGRYEVDAPKVEIHGEVLRPGVFPLAQGMTAAQLVRMAGGFKKDALLDTADLVSYSIRGGSKAVGDVTPIRIGAAVAGADASSDVRLKAGDILTVHQITGWGDIGEAVTIEGQVSFPGSYGFTEGERLSSILRRAGGFRETAYPAGAVLVREQVRELEQKSREELIRQIETSSAAARLSPSLAPGDSGQTLQLIQAQQEQVLARLKSQPPSGRLVVHLSGDIASWANTDADIELRRGDVLTIPKRPGFVLVIGQVYNATAITFDPGKTAGWYLQNAGGTNATASRKDIFVIRANGSVIGRRSGGWFEANVLSTRLDPGDVVVVPQKVVGASVFWRNLLTAAQLASSIAITAAVTSL